MEKEEWLKKYKARLIERGLNEEEAQDIAEAVDVDDPGLDDDPESAADDELNYQASDG